MPEFVPRPYQEQIISFIMTHPRCMVWAGMGMGKTSATLAALAILKDCVSGGPALIVAPLRVAQSTWPDEVAKWDFGLAVSVICGTEKQRLEAMHRRADIYCVNYEQLPWLVAQQGGRWPYAVVVCDESTRLKGFRLRSGTMRAKALATVAHRSPRFIELTGTPTANGLLDLWGQAWFIDKGQRLGKTMSAYEQAYFTPVRTGGEAYMVRWDPRPGSAAKIRAKLADVSRTVNAEDWFDIEQPIVNDIEVDLPPKALRQYREMEREFYLELEDEGAVEAVNALSRMNKCLQIAGGAVYGEDGKAVKLHDAKLDALKSVVEEAAGAPVLVAYQFKHEADRILRAIPGARLLDKNPGTIRDWNAGRIPVLVAHPASCGHGLNLQDGGNILVFFGLGYNYEQYAQMCERIGPTRQAQSGHPRPVFIHRILAKGTLDREVVAALGGKKDVLDFILEKRNE